MGCRPDRKRFDRKAWGAASGIASGVYTVLGTNLPVLGSKALTDYVCGDIEKAFGGRFEFEPDPVKAARLMIAHMDKKRAALKLPPVMYAPREAGSVPAAVSAL